MYANANILSLPGKLRESSGREKEGETEKKRESVPLMWCPHRGDIHGSGECPVDGVQCYISSAKVCE